MEELNSYIEKVKKHIQTLKELQPKDKLDYSSGIELVILHVNASTLGWSKWIQSPTIMKKFTEEELKTIFEQMKDIAINYLNLDIESTKKMIRIESKETKKEEKNPLAV